MFCNSRVKGRVLDRVSRFESQKKMHLAAGKNPPSHFRLRLSVKYPRAILPSTGLSLVQACEVCKESPSVVTRVYE
jgi:hypothetical protein